MSLKQFIGANSIANEIRLERQVRKVASLVVEGSDDRKLYGTLFDKNGCSIVVAYGKDRVLEVVSLLENDNTLGILGLIDKDFDEIERVGYLSLNVIVTDEHDLECMILRSNALSRLLVESADEAKVSHFEAKAGGVRGILLAPAQVVGCARLVSQRQGLALDFDGLQFRFIDQEDLVADLDRLVDILVSRTSGCGVSRLALREMIQGEVEDEHEPWQICCGHDLVQRGIQKSRLNAVARCTTPLNSSALCEQPSVPSVCSRALVSILVQRGNQKSPLIAGSRCTISLESSALEQTYEPSVCSRALAIALRRCIGHARGHEADPSIVASKLRLAYQLEDFRATAMFLAIRRWENEHTEFAFLR